MASKKSLCIGVFGGSFNPPHLGHRRIVIELLERGIVDEIWLLPCREHAFGKELRPGTLRCQELALLIASLPKKTRNRVRVEEFELNQAGLSITYDTLRALQKRDPQFAYQFIIGSDQVADFPKWHHYQSLLQEFPVLVYPRLPHPYPKLLPGMRSLSHFPIIDISSTQIRHLQAIGDKTWQTLVIQ